jgi:hypothetical protein
MPQANITYNTPYNRALVKTLSEMEQKNFHLNRYQYDPTPMGFRNADSFHDPEKVASVQQILTGGVAPAKFILNGTSPAYPPLNMNAGLAVSSGGGRNKYAGVGGAVGGSFFSDALSVAKTVAPLVAPLLKGGVPSGGVMSGGVPSGGFNLGSLVKKASKGIKDASAIAKTGKEAYDLYQQVMGGASAALKPADIKKLAAFNRKLMRGGSFLSDAFNVVKQLAPIVAPLIMGAGRSKMADKVLMVEKAMKTLHGGSFWKDFGKGFVKGFTGTLGVAKDLAPIVLPFLGAGRKVGGAMVGAFLDEGGKVQLGSAVKKRKVGGVKSGGVSLKDAIDFTKTMGSKAVREVKKRGAKALKAVADDLKASVVREATRAVSGGGRAARAAIVKKVMAERGVKMIRASQIVKEEGLYKK